MDIYKVLKKQRKSYNRFMMFMGFIFLLLPSVLFFTKQYNLFFIGYLVVIELLILIVILKRYNDEYLKFSVEDDKLVVGIAGGRIKYKVLCSRVTIIHTIPQDKYFDILIITKAGGRNKKLRTLTQKLMERYPAVEKEYRKVKMPHEGLYYYFIIRRGGAKKYLLLETIYSSCFDAVFTEEAIENIKEYRQSNKTKTS